VRRFNETFQHLYQRPPSELRRRAAVTSPAAEITLFLPYRPPYDWETMRRFLEVRVIPGLETVTQDSYSRVIELRGLTGSITVAHAPEQSALRVSVRFPHLAALSVIIARIRRMFDLSADPGAIASVLSADPALAPLVAARPGLRVPGGWNGFEIAVRAVLGQQVTLQAGTRLAGKVVDALGSRVAHDLSVDGLTHSFPPPERFETDTIAKLGMPRARAAALAGVAAAFTADPHLFDPRRDLEEAITQLRKLPGIGEWTAQYIAMRALGETDAFLAGDVALQRIIATNGQRPDAAALLARAERWRPWRAYVVLHLWMSDDKTKPNPSHTKPRKEPDHALAA
jgi:AraC family transcriptional regulator of adaptative response / DNA-3-methyladenine glycosylase II